MGKHEKHSLKSVSILLFALILSPSHITFAKTGEITIIGVHISYFMHELIVHFFKTT